MQQTVDESYWTETLIIETSNNSVRFRPSIQARDHSRYPSRSRRDRLARTGSGKTRLPASIIQNSNRPPILDACPSIAPTRECVQTERCYRNLAQETRVRGFYIWWRKPSGTASTLRRIVLSSLPGRLLTIFAGDHRPRTRCASLDEAIEVGHGLSTRCQADHQHLPRRQHSSPHNPRR